MLDSWTLWNLDNWGTLNLDEFLEDPVYVHFNGMNFVATVSTTYSLCVDEWAISHNDCWEISGVHISIHKEVSECQCE
jgi:hypothetical protein